MSFSEDYKIPDKLVGLVIGRGGEQIKRLQMESGCKIRIASDGDGTIERSCTLTGSQEAIDEAKRMLNDVVSRGMNRERGNFNNNAGGGGGGYGQNNGGGGGGQFGGNRRYNNGGGQGGYGQNNQF